MQSALLLTLTLMLLGGCASTPSGEDNGQRLKQAARTNVQLGIEYMRDGDMEMSLNKFEKALATAEQLLKTYGDSSQDSEIEVVANASAIRMLRTGYSPYSDRVRQLQDRYFNLTFLACKDAIDHIRELEGPESDVSLLPDVETTPSALEHILERLSEGWVYINV